MYTVTVMCIEKRKKNVGTFPKSNHKYMSLSHAHPFSTGILIKGDRVKASFMAISYAL
jgi:hypothetical protein